MAATASWRTDPLRGFLADANTPGPPRSTRRSRASLDPLRGFRDCAHTPRPPREARRSRVSLLPASGAPCGAPRPDLRARPPVRTAGGAGEGHSTGQAREAGRKQGMTTKNPKTTKGMDLGIRGQVFFMPFAAASPAVRSAQGSISRGGSGHLSPARVSSTSWTWPFTLTLGQTWRMMPAGSTRKVLRRMPSVSLPYMNFFP